MKARKVDAKFTTRQLYWSDADLIALYKRKETAKNGQEVDEKDREVFRRVIAFWVKHHKPLRSIPLSTMPAYKEATK